MFFTLPTKYAEMLREHQRSINRAQRDIDRERTNLQNQEKKVIMEIKKAAKQGQMVTILHYTSTLVSLTWG